MNWLSGFLNHQQCEDWTFGGLGGQLRKEGSTHHISSAFFVENEGGDTIKYKIETIK